MAQAGTIETNSVAPATCTALTALILLGTRFTQGFIFWGGATRRLIYDFHSVDGVDQAAKLDFASPGFVAAKLTHALPGVLWVQGPIEWTLRHPDLIVASVWLWTFAELAVGLGLMLGFATRASAGVSLWLNVTLMVIFGWMGSTCLDEWTMAVSGVAMSSAVVLAGGGAWSLDERYIAPAGWAQRYPWITWICSGPLPGEWAHKLALWLGGACIAFTIVTYHLLFGAVVTPLHSRVNFHRHDIALTHAALSANGAVSFDAYVDAGPDTGAAYIVAAKLLEASGAAIAQWDGAALAGLPAGTIRNAYPYAWASKFKTELIGFSGQTGARATITLPPPAAGRVAPGQPYVLVLEAIDGAKWQAAVNATGR
jgi:thiosulfate dehydrogenase (quinone)